MKHLILLLVAYLFCYFSNAQTMSDFDWLEAKWERENTKPGSSAFEIWEKSNAKFDGIGFTMKGLDTVFVEKLNILKKEDEFFYVAEVAHNPVPTYFKITEYAEDLFICENPDHDFPKKISYTLKGVLLNVIISGDGKSMQFNFRKKPN